MKIFNKEIELRDFRLLNRRVVNALKKTRENLRSMKSMYSWVGYKKKMNNRVKK